MFILCLNNFHLIMFSHLFLYCLIIQILFLCLNLFHSSFLKIIKIFHSCLLIHYYFIFNVLIVLFITHLFLLKNCLLFY